MEILIYGWDWLPLEDVGAFGIVYLSIVAAVVIFKVSMSKPEK